MIAGRIMDKVKRVGWDLKVDTELGGADNQSTAYMKLMMVRYSLCAFQ